MPLFKKKENKILQIKEKSNPLEKDIQKTTEENLNEIFGVDFISSEFQLNGLRIDTLCFNKESNSFVIIEYKKDRSFSVIDQGFAYLSLMLNHKADFLLEYNEKNKGKSLNRESVNWEQSRVIFISPSFTVHQKAAINFKNLPLELWEIHYYDEDLIEYEQIEPLENSENIETVTGGDKLIKEVTKSIKVYDLDLHLKRGSDDTRKLFYALKEEIMDLGEIKENPKQEYVGYRISDGHINFVAVHFYKEKLELTILIPDKNLEDPKKWTRKVPDSFGWAKNLKFLTITSEKDIRYAMNLIEQSYEFNKDR
jgi:predicted transport protein